MCVYEGCPPYVRAGVGGSLAAQAGSRHGPGSRQGVRVLQVARPFPRVTSQQCGCLSLCPPRFRTACACVARPWGVPAGKPLPPPAAAAPRRQGPGTAEGRERGPRIGSAACGSPRIRQRELCWVGAGKRGQRVPSRCQRLAQTVASCNRHSLHMQRCDANEPGTRPFPGPPRRMAGFLAPASLAKFERGLAGGVPPQRGRPRGARCPSDHCSGTTIPALRTIIFALFAAIRSARARSYSLRGAIATHSVEWCPKMMPGRWKGGLQPHDKESSSSARAVHALAHRQLGISMGACTRLCNCFHCSTVTSTDCRLFVLCSASITSRHGGPGFCKPALDGKQADRIALHACSSRRGAPCRRRRRRSAAPACCSHLSTSLP